MVNDGIITSSPSFIPAATTAKSKAIEPLHTAIPCLRFTRVANFSSNCFTNGPSDEIQPVSIHSFKYFFRYHLIMARLLKSFFI